MRRVRAKTGDDGPEVQAEAASPTRPAPQVRRRHGEWAELVARDDLASLRSAPEESRKLGVERPRARPCQHHDHEPDAVERLGETQKIIEPIGAINGIPSRNPFDRIAGERSEAHNEEPEGG